MFRSVKQLYGFKLGALDGEMGHVKGFYFDDKDWVIRYLVADTGSWIPGRKVLISPYALGSIYPGGKTVQVNLTRDKVENSPSIETELPVARQHERDYYRYYNWPVYWEGPGLWGMNPVPLVQPVYQPPPSDQESSPLEGEENDADSHLRSTQEVTGYQIQATDGDIGHLEDFLINDETWAIDALVVATGHWWSGKDVLVPTAAVERVSWEESKSFVALTRSELRDEPQYERSTSGPQDHDPRIFRE